MVYDITISTLKGESATDLAVSMDGDKDVLNLGDNVKLTITAFNKGPRSADVKVDYQIPSALKLLSSNGAGVYDTVSGVWDVGILPAGGFVSLELFMQSVVWGFASNVVTVYSNLPDVDVVDNRAVYDVVVLEQVADIPLVILPVDPPFNPQIPPGSGGDSGGGAGGSGGSGGSDGSGGSPGSGNSGGASTPKTQLDRDITGVREAVSSGEVNKPLPEWNLTHGKPDEDEKLNEEWKSFLIKFTGEILFYALLSAVPNEYLRGLTNAITNSFKTLGNIARYLGYGKEVKQISKILERGKMVLKSPLVESVINKWSAIMDGLSPNLGMKLLEKALIKIFPNSANEIRLLLNIYSSIEFLNDPFGTINSIIDAIFAMFAKELPDPRDLSSLL